MKIKRILILIVVLAIIAGAGFFGLQYWKNQKETPTVTTIDIQGTINDIGELATAEYAFTITQEFEKPSITVAGAVNLPFTSSKVLYSYEGIIKAGIQFSQIEITQNQQQKKIYVRLPPAEILSTEIDNNSLKVYDEKYSIINRVKFSDLNSSIEEAKENAKESAKDHGLLDRANENARVIIRSTIGSLVDLNEYELIFH